MSYKIGQFRRNQTSNYGTQLSYTLELIENVNSIINFYDPGLKITGSEGFSFLNSYYLKFEVDQLIESAQDFTIKLKSSDVDKADIQEVKTLTVKQGQEKTTFELIFNPSTGYDTMVFELSRLALDFNLANPDGTSGRIMNINILDIHIVNNIIPQYLSSIFPGLTSLKKIGIQGPPGLLFALDGEEIRLGRSGVYELYKEDIEVSYIGFVVNDSSISHDGKDFFIMDFKY